MGIFIARFFALLSFLLLTACFNNEIDGSIEEPSEPPPPPPPTKIVIGQPDFTTNLGIQAGSGYLLAITSCNGKLFLVDEWNNRILGWNSIPTTTGQSPDFALLQPSLNTGVFPTSVSIKKGNILEGVHCDGTRLIVADEDNNRVLIWNSIPSEGNVDPDLVLGQPDFTSNTANNPSISASTLNGPTRVFSDGTKLFVSDARNDRVLIWNTFPTSNQQAADVVLGQANMTSNGVNTGGLTQGLNNPLGIWTDGTVLFVADRDNHRVVKWNTVPTVDHTVISIALGQPNTTSSGANNPALGASSMNWPHGISSNGTAFFVADRLNNRVLKWNAIPTTDGEAADIVLGQPNLTSNASPGSIGDPSSNTQMNSPSDVLVVGTRLFVPEFNGIRVNVWNTFPTANQQPADYTLMQQDSIQTNYNIPVAGVSKNTFNRPGSIAGTSDRMAITDPFYHRVFLWNSDPKDGGEPDLVLGQPDFTSNAKPTVSASSVGVAHGVEYRGNQFFVASFTDSRVSMWNSWPTSNNQAADIVLGQPNKTSTGGNNGGRTVGLNFPLEVSSDGTRVLVADMFNNRVAIWNSIPGTDGATIDIALGQPNTNSGTMNNGGLGADTLAFPSGVYVHSDGKVVVADTFNHRVLLWNSFPTTDGQAADVVLGQPNFTSNAANNGGISASTMEYPEKAFYDGNILFVSDTNNNRVLGWRGWPSTPGQAADFVFGQDDMNSSMKDGGALGPSTIFRPTGVFSQNGSFYLSDAYGGRVIVDFSGAEFPE